MREKAFLRKGERANRLYVINWDYSEVEEQIEVQSKRT